MIDQTVNAYLHVRIVHEKMKGFQCDKCHLITSKIDKLESHITLIYEGIKDSKCHECLPITSPNSNLVTNSGVVNEKINEFQCKKKSLPPEMKKKVKNHIEKNQTKAFLNFSVVS